MCFQCGEKGHIGPNCPTLPPPKLPSEAGKRAKEAADAARADVRAGRTPKIATAGVDELSQSMRSKM